jgi:hypothetical protein
MSDNDSTSSTGGKKPLRKRYLVVGAVVLSLVMVGAGIGIGAGVWSGGTATAAAASPATNAAPPPDQAAAARAASKGLISQDRLNGPNVGDYPVKLKIVWIRTHDGTAHIDSESPPICATSVFDGHVAGTGTEEIPAFIADQKGFCGIWFSGVEFHVQIGTQKAFVDVHERIGGTYYVTCPGKLTLPCDDQRDNVSPTEPVVGLG